MDVLVTGATGFIGSNLAESLKASGARVHALVRNPGRLGFLAGLDVHVLEGDLFRVPDLPADLEAVFHVAGMTKSLKPEPYYTVNRDGTASLLDAVIRRGSRPKFVFLSSLSASGPSAPGETRKESDPPAPVTHYGRSKLAAEAEVLRRRDDLPVSVARVGVVYGPRDPEFARYFRLVKRGLLPVIGREKTPLGVCYVKDLCRGLQLLASHPAAAGEIFNFGHPAVSSMEDIGRRAAEILGLRPRRVVFPLPVVGGIALTGEVISRLTGKATIYNRQKFREYAHPGWVADVAKAKAVLSFEAAFSLDEGLRETVGWYRANGWL